VKTSLRTRQNGFSLIELMIVIAIILVITALAMPAISRAITNIRLRGAMGTVSGQLQKTRIEAVRTNRVHMAQIGDLNGATVMFVDQAVLQPRAIDSAIMPIVQLPQGVNVELVTKPPILFPSDKLLNYSSPASPNPFQISFNQRGLPCIYDPATGGCPYDGDNSAYEYYFRLSNPFGDQWSALTITPAGRIRVWSFNGTEWY
jgi:prepilin-type N-terminal cleavage/methylation domain-containing protein